MNNNEWLSVPEAMAYVSRSEASIYRWKRNGWLKTKKGQNNSLLIDIDSLNKCKTGKQQKEKTENKGIVYILAEENSQYIKIGMTNQSVQSRLKNLQTGNPRRLQIKRIYHCENMAALEQKLHNLLQDCHVILEWFVIDDLSTVDDFIETQSDVITIRD